MESTTRSGLVLAFRAVAMVMAVLGIAFTALDAGSLELYVMFLSIGLFALALAGIMESEGGD